MPRKSFKFAKPNVVKIFRLDHSHEYLLAYSVHYFHDTGKAHRACSVCGVRFKLGDLVVSLPRLNGGNKGYRRHYFHAGCFPKRKRT